MNAARSVGLSMMVVAVIAASCWSNPGLAQRCDGRAVVSADADVYESLPRFVTGRGWQGHVIARLQSGTQVYVCWEQSTQFGLSSKAWVQIAFRNRGATTYGWMLKEATRQAAHAREAPWLARMSPVGSALAATPAPADDKGSWTLGDPPPQPPPPMEPTTSNAQPDSLVADLVVLYGPLFVAMVLGMLAKAVVDWLDEPDRTTVMPHVRSGIIAILVSPIVFLGFLNAGQFSVSTQAYLVLMLLAFQNGFFWQTVLKRGGGSGGRRRQSDAKEPQQDAPLRLVHDGTQVQDSINEPKAG
jgi:hypothetical protein